MGIRQSCTFVNPDGSQVKGYRWRNPDGSVGGWVAATARVHPTAIVQLGAMVAAGAVIPEGAVVKKGEIVGPPSNSADRY